MGKIVLDQPVGVHVAKAADIGLILRQIVGSNAQIDFLATLA